MMIISMVKILVIVIVTDEGYDKDGLMSKLMVILIMMNYGNSISHNDNDHNGSEIMLMTRTVITRQRD